MDFAFDYSGDESSRESVLENSRNIQEKVVSSNADGDQFDGQFDGLKEKWYMNVARDETKRRPGRIKERACSPNKSKSQERARRIKKSIWTPLDSSSMNDGSGTKSNARNNMQKMLATSIR